MPVEGVTQGYPCLKPLLLTCNSATCADMAPAAGCSGGDGISAEGCIASKQ